MAYVKSAKTVHFATPNGYALLIEPKVVTWIPDLALPFALKQGAIECDESGKVKFGEDDADDPNAPQVPDAPKVAENDAEDPAKRKDAIKAGIRYLCAVGNPKDFNANNLPKAKAIEKVLGFKVDGTELSEAFGEVQDEV